MIFIIPWVSISLTERNNCSFPAGLNEFFLNSGAKGLILFFTHMNIQNDLRDLLIAPGSQQLGDYH